ncbi:hypothetical protein K443DRAFT_670952 [Laccaria amethystina LaAM-08-1]|jgi:hypothetical protein|uniref:Uncharacterized protein n=1 Tax=Laccaria amethystina LaAM-08-1 TaxID=1095629 RepID=A0A0C9YQJ9_9AGAR|nr:hypothetical protein K443DRAFT_670952 [Laccaria amethystina LaAM-08-1]
MLEAHIETDSAGSETEHFLGAGEKGDADNCCKLHHQLEETDLLIFTEREIKLDPLACPYAIQPSSARK